MTINYKKVGIIWLSTILEATHVFDIWCTSSNKVGCSRKINEFSTPIIISPIGLEQFDRLIARVWAYILRFLILNNPVLFNANLEPFYGYLMPCPTIKSFSNTKSSLYNALSLYHLSIFLYSWAKVTLHI